MLPMDFIILLGDRNVTFLFLWAYVQIYFYVNTGQCNPTRGHLFRLPGCFSNLPDGGEW